MNNTTSTNNTQYLKGIPVITNDKMSCRDPEGSPALVGEMHGVVELVCTYLGDDYETCYMYKDSDCTVLKKATERLKKD